MDAPRLMHTARDGVALRAHLLHLPREDRHTRFGHYATDDTIGRYVDRLVERGDTVLLHDDPAQPGRVIAALHLAVLDDGIAEIGISVEREFRGHSYARRLIDAAGVLAFCIGIKRLRVVVDPNNRPMIALAERCGFVLAHSDIGELSGDRPLHAASAFTAGWVWWLSRLWSADGLQRFSSWRPANDSDHDSTPYTSAANR